MKQKLVGQTRTAGFQVGVRRTLPIAADRAWELLVSPDGAHIWLGDTQGQALAEGAIFQLADGAVAKVTVFKPGSHLRLAWQPQEWPRHSIVQLRVIPSGASTVVAFHQEHLPGAAERAQRYAYYTGVLDMLQRAIE